MNKYAQEMSGIIEERTTTPSLDDVVLSTGHVKTAGEQFGEILQYMSKEASVVPRQAMTRGSAAVGALLGAIGGAGAGATAGGISGKPGERMSTAGKGALIGALTGAAAGGAGFGLTGKYLADFTDDAIDHISKRLPERELVTFMEDLAKKPELAATNILSRIPTEAQRNLNIKDYVGRKAEQSLKKSVAAFIGGGTLPTVAGVGTGVGLGIHSRRKNPTEKKSPSLRKRRQ